MPIIFIVCLTKRAAVPKKKSNISKYNRKIDIYVQHIKKSNISTSSKTKINKVIYPKKYNIKLHTNYVQQAHPLGRQIVIQLNNLTLRYQLRTNLSRGWKEYHVSHCYTLGLFGAHDMIET